MPVHDAGWQHHPVDGGPPAPSAGSLWPLPQWLFVESVMSRGTCGLPGPGPGVSATEDGELEERTCPLHAPRTKTPRATTPINARVRVQSAIVVGGPGPWQG